MSLCYGWSFCIPEYELSRGVIRPGEQLSIDITILNDGLRIGTVYLILLVANPYDHKKLVYDSDRDLIRAEKQRFRLVDIPAGKKSKYAVNWKFPNNAEIGVYDIKLQLWNPSKLFQPKRHLFRFYSHRFYETQWHGAIEVVPPQGDLHYYQTTKELNTTISVFISYSWDSTNHQKWVLELADELTRNGIKVIIDKHDLLPGEEITEFIERGITECNVFLMICSEQYTIKANNRLGGVGWRL